MTHSRQIVGARGKLRHRTGRADRQLFEITQPRDESVSHSELKRRIAVFRCQRFERQDSERLDCARVLRCVVSLKFEVRERRSEEQNNQA